MEQIKRYIIFTIGLFLCSLGVSFVTRADLGTSPISSIPYVLSLNFPMSLGEFTIFFSLFLIVLQLLILRKNFKLEHILQIPVSIAFGYFIDFTMILLKNLQTELYLVKVMYLLIGCAILAIGVYLEVLADVVMLPGESFVRAVVFRWKTEFGITKIAFDATMSISAVILSLIFVRRLYGVREGTIIAAFLVGFIARFIGRHLSFLPSILFPAVTKREELLKGEPICIAIGRQYGSGGREIGRMLADKLAFTFYDKEIIQLTAGSTGYTPQYISRKEETMTSSLIYDLVSQMYAYSKEYTPPEDAIFQSESDIMNKVSQEGNCVIVGRCADYILGKRQKCLKIFLFAPIEYRVKRIMELEQLSAKDAQKKIQQIDRHRAEHYRYYTHQLWGMSPNYHICIDTSAGLENTEKIIMELLEHKIISTNRQMKGV